MNEALSYRKKVSAGVLKCCIGERTDLVMWDRNERVESRMTPRFHTSGDGEVEKPYMTRARSPTFLSSGAGANTIS